MDRVVSPPKKDFDRLRQPMTAGEKKVFDLFDNYLAPEWEIYVQPHMNGLRPDFVLLNPSVGIAVFEVKDWDLDAMHYSVEERKGRVPGLIAIKDGKKFSRQSDNPVEKVYRYKNEIFELYCPRLQQGAGFAVITAGVIFPFADDERVRSLFAMSLKHRGMDRYPAYNPVSGASAIESGNIGTVFPEGVRQYSKVMNPAIADDIRYWLVEPDYASTQREPLILDPNQRGLVTGRTQSGYRRIRGAAGSGKSLVLAARAAELLNQGKQILVVTFNITLLHYLMDIAVRWPRERGNTRSDITWLHFHAWCKRVCEDAGCEEQYSQLWADDANPNRVLDHVLPGLVGNILDSQEGSEVPRYDAVLVDEGQDFMPHWWSVLRKVCKQGGEMLLVADATQDIYETARAWTDEAMTGAGFRGGWAELPVSYRMPQQALTKAREFAERFLPEDITNLPENRQIEGDLEPAELRWVQINPEQAAEVCCKEILRFFQKSSLQDLAITDATFLCGLKSFGYEVVKLLGGKGIKSVHTYHPDEQESRRQKVGFYMGDARVKATTLHSFKGWESRILVVYIGETVSEKDLALIYTGLTRLKRSTKGSCLTVVSSAPQLAEYGRSWPSHESLQAAPFAM
ncbi:AAA family ATPase [Parahaliea maris]|uniref:AAA family ATPase n=1 Tax=Parahaliea maris TaxID=2716870 RepID=A0A5C8ZZW7_9GAMM|nr:NERD domain-containing protein/DEAD/DEAH box helicase [Parahaliea maris]TXS92761.1 AAA family ATPase [Parahaliea maris]